MNKNKDGNEIGYTSKRLDVVIGCKNRRNRQMLISDTVQNVVFDK